MRWPRLRFSVLWLMIAVAIAACICLNLRLWIWTGADFPPADPVSTFRSRILACVVGPFIGVAIGLLTWRLQPSDGTLEDAIRREAVAWGIGGGAAWVLGAFALFVGQPFDGQIPATLLVIGGMGMVGNGAAGVLMGLCRWSCGRRKPPESQKGGSTVSSPDGSIELGLITEASRVTLQNSGKPRRPTVKRRGNSWYG